MTCAYTTVNQTLVTLFNHIMRIEEEALTLPRLSIREVHVIEAVYLAMETGNNTMRNIATHLAITQGSLSVSVHTLEKKGYLLRQKDDQDKRLIRVMTTPKAQQINDAHKQFHHEMTSAVIGSLSESDLSALILALTNVEKYFTTKEKRIL